MFSTLTPEPTAQPLPAWVCVVGLVHAVVICAVLTVLALL